MKDTRRSTVNDAGRIPRRVWIGVTGHRDLTPTPELLAAIRDAVGRIKSLMATGSGEFLVGVTSGLAEGADRIVPELVLAEDPTAALEAALPLAPHDYLRDFATDASKRDFTQLLGRAKLTTRMPASHSRVGSYVSVGDYIVDRSDVLLAVWDGKPARGPGGTAAVVRQARERHLPVFWIHAGESFTIHEEIPAGYVPETLRDLDAYNRWRVAAGDISEDLADHHDRLLQAVRKAQLPLQEVEAFAQWALPYLVRADRVARRYQRRAFRAGYALLLLAATALLSAAASGFLGDRTVPGTSEPVSSVLAALEFAVLMGFLSTWFLARRARVRDRWLACRSLAERCRVAFFGCVVGLGDGAAAAFTAPRGLFAPGDWADRAFREVWICRPVSPAGRGVGPPVSALGCFLNEAWIRDQRTYYRNRAEWHLGRHRIVSILIYGLFALTVAAVAVHALEPFGRQFGGWWLSFTSIVLGASAGVAGGVQAQHDFHGNHQRFEQIERTLRELSRRIESSGDLERLQDVAAIASRAMLEEHRGWYDVMQVRDFEFAEYG